MTTTSIDDLARDLLAALDATRQIPSLSESVPGFDLPAAYRVAGAVRHLREARGETAVGRKIGFTNITIRDEYDVHAPIWGHVYDTTRRAISSEPVPLATLVEPRIEPEIMLHLSRAPEPDMDDIALMGCIGAVSHGFEIVQSLFAGWRFTPADTVAAFGLHGFLLTGEPRRIAPDEAESWADRLRGFSIELSRNGDAVERGEATNVLGGGPLAALRHLVELLDADPASAPLMPGEIVSTGTVTRALPIAAGETWSTRIEGIDLPGVSVSFA